MIRTCKYCGEEFEAIGTQAYCNRYHYATCVICGKQFVYDPRTLKQCCSRKCSSELRKQSIQATKKICKLCGKEFIPENNTQIYCKDIHFAPCVICGEPVQIPYNENYWLDRTCSIECTTRRRANTCIERYGVDWPCQLEQCRQASGAKSTVNDKFKSICESNGILLESEYHLGSYSYDFKVVDQNILIELDPTYTHNVIGNHWNLKGLAYDYHKLKSELAESQGFQCIHIFDWDDCTKILNIIRPKQAVYARQCEILEVSSTDCDSFLNWYHLQNTCRGQKFKLGLYHNGELIQVMAFGKPRYNKNYQWELLRLCTKSGYCVIGGASKLFRYFINNYNPQSTISYCDKSKFKGEVYTEIGMSLKYTTPPAKVWSNGNQKITDNLLRQRGFDQIFHTEFGKGTSNDELMLKHGWLPVYDCGQAVYEWINMEV